MDYEKAYKDALERMKSWARGEHPECFTEAQKAAEFIFPELAESNDEEIRKVLINYFNRYKEQEECGVKTFYGIPTGAILAWLEKQGEKFIPKDINEAALQYVDTCAVDGEITHGNVTEPYWNNHSMMSAYKAGWLKKQASKKCIKDIM